MGGQKPFSKGWKFFSGIGKIAENIRKKREGKKGEIPWINCNGQESIRECKGDGTWCMCLALSSVTHYLVLHNTLCYTSHHHIIEITITDICVHCSDTWYIMLYKVHITHSSWCYKQSAWCMCLQINHPESALMFFTCHMTIISIGLRHIRDT